MPIQLHPEDKQIAIRFIDHVRLHKSKPENPELEILARYVAEFAGVNPDKRNSDLADKFASLMDNGEIL